MKNGIVENHITVDTLEFGIRVTENGFTLNGFDLKLEVIDKGFQNSNCGGEHKIELPEKSLLVSGGFASFAYAYIKGIVKKVCIFLD